MRARWGLNAIAPRLKELLRENLLLVSLAIILGAIAVALILSGAWDAIKEGLRGPAEELVANYGLPGTFLVMVLAGTALPMASPLIVAFCASLGAPPIPLALIAALGYVLGLMVNYGLGYVLGLKFVKEKVPEERFEKLSSWLDKWGLGLVMAFSLVPVTPLETLSLICGAFHMNAKKFALISYLGKAIQFCLFAFLGSELAWLVWD